MKAFNKLSDRVLSAFVPARAASACVPPDCITYRESGSGWCRTRRCCYNCAGSWICSAWTSC